MYYFNKFTAFHSMNFSCLHCFLNVTCTNIGTVLNVTVGFFESDVLWTSASIVKTERTDFGHLCIFIGPNASPLEVWP